MLDRLTARVAGVVTLPQEEEPPKVADLTWLDEVYSAVAASLQDDAVDLMFDQIDDLLCEGKAPQVNDLLSHIDIKRLDTTLMLAVLSITKPAAELLTNRDGFVRRVEKSLRQQAPERAERLLSGLR